VWAVVKSGSEGSEKISETGKLLLEYHLAYKKEQGWDVPQKDFADYIGIDDKYYNHIYKGRQRPGKEIARLLAEFFDDMRFYDAAGYERPDPGLHLVQAYWRELPDALSKKITDIVGDYKARKKKK
jgi:DNA-binding XRE family transcriptional regulator